MANHMYSDARRLVTAAVLFAAFTACGIGPAAAQATGGDSGDYQYAITPHLWATRMKGDVKTGRLPKTTLDMNFSDILDTLDLGFMTAIKVRKSRWAFVFDGMYMNVSDSGSASSSDGALSVSADAEVRQKMLAFVLAYRVLEKKHPLDLIAGTRYNRVPLHESRLRDKDGFLYDIANDGLYVGMTLRF